VAYLANEFPSPLEPYVGDEIEELRRRGIGVIACSSFRPKRVSSIDGAPDQETLYLWPPRLSVALGGLFLFFWEFKKLRGFLRRALFRGTEPHRVRLKAVLHTWLGACYALLLRPHGVQHIHVHHGYFSSWIGMVAARMLGIDYSITLHGSDLLLQHSAFLDTKLERCRECFTVSEYNREYIFRRYPSIDPGKVFLRRLGVELAALTNPAETLRPSHCFVLLAVGRLHAVKNHSFLIDACAELKSRGMNFQCLIAGEGRELAASRTPHLQAWPGVRDRAARSRGAARSAPAL
jgi:colanic acid/amylovoran biosynthesis glycosyltransferase